MGKLSISSKIPVIPLDFWDDIYKAPRKEWHSIVKKYDLNSEQLHYVVVHREEVFGRLKAAEDSKASWAASACKCYAKGV